MSVAVIKGVTSAVGMTFGLRKCATVYMREGKMTLTLPDKTRREEIKEEESYQYLGIPQTLTTDIRRAKVK